MARSSYVYLVGPDLDGALYAFTVKHEARSFVERHKSGDWAVAGTIQRIPDGAALHGGNRKTWTVPEFLSEPKT